MSRLALRLALLALGSIALGSCSPVLTRDDVLIRPGAITVLAGASISATVAQTVANPVRVRVLDTDGEPMPGRPVDVTVTGGTVQPTSLTTDQNGEAQVTSWTMPTQSGTAILTVTVRRHDAADAQPVASVTAQVAPGPPVSLTAVGGAGETSAPVNSSVQASATARDSYGNGVPGVRIAFQIGQSPSNAGITGTNPGTTGTNGVVTVTWRLDTLVRTNTLLITGADVTTLSTSLTVTGTAGPASRIESISARSQTVNPGAAVGDIPEVRVTDQYGNPVGSITVTFSTTGGTITAASGCSSSTTCQRTTGTDGRAALTSWTIGSALGTYTLNATTSSPALTMSPPFTAVTPVTESFAYVTSYSNATWKLNKIAVSTHTVVHTLDDASFGSGLSITPTGAHVYVSGNPTQVVATATNAVVASIGGLGTQPWPSAVTPNGAFVYVVNHTTPGTVSVISTATNTVVATVPVGNHPYGVAVTPNSAFVYVMNNQSSNVSVISTATHTVVATIPVAASPATVAISPDGTLAYVGHSFDLVTVVSTANNTVVATMSVGLGHAGIAITPDGSFLYVLNERLSTVSVIATATNTEVASIPVGNNPVGVAITPDGSFAYVTNYNSTFVSVIATATNTVVASIPVGGQGGSVAIMR